MGNGKGRRRERGEIERIFAERANEKTKRGKRGVIEQTNPWTTTAAPECQQWSSKRKKTKDRRRRHTKSQIRPLPPPTESGKLYFIFVMARGRRRYVPCRILLLYHDGKPRECGKCGGKSHRPPLRLYLAFHFSERRHKSGGEKETGGLFRCGFVAFFFFPLLWRTKKNKCSAAGKVPLLPLESRIFAREAWLLGGDSLEVEKAEIPKQ